jgi:hypothetical protein
MRILLIKIKMFGERLTAAHSYIDDYGIRQEKSPGHSSYCIPTPQTKQEEFQNSYHGYQE